MRTVFYFPWEWSGKVWLRVAGTVGWMAVLIGHTHAHIAVGHFLTETWGIVDFWGYGTYLWAGTFFLIGALAVNWVVDSLVATHKETKGRG